MSEFHVLCPRGHVWDANSPNATAEHAALHHEPFRQIAFTQPYTEAASAQDFIGETMAPQEWLVDGLVPAGPAIGGLFGQFKAGKSLAGLQLATAVATGRGLDFLGHHVTHPGASVFVEYEGSRVHLQGRVKLMLTKYGVLGTPIPLYIIHRPSHKIDSEAGEAWLMTVCTDRRLCVIGPVAKAASIQRENEPTEWQALAERLQRVTDATGCTVVLIHHTRKPNQAWGQPRHVDDFFNSARGSNAYMGAVDFGLGVQRDPDEVDGTLFNLQRDGDSGLESYDFDRQSLCIFRSDRPISRPTAADRLEQVYGLIESQPGITRAKLSELLNVSSATVKEYLSRLGDRVREDGMGSQPRTYRPAGGGVEPL